MALAFDSYADLQDVVIEFIGRSDAKTVAIVPVLISLAETQISRRARVRTLREQITVASDEVPLPAACAELRSVRLVSSSPWLDTPLDLGTVAGLATTRARNSTTGRPIQAAVVDGKLLLAPAPDATYTIEITYYEKLVPLSDTNPSNTLLVEAADLYLFGALAEAEPYLENDARVPLWQGKFEAALDALNTQRQRQEFGGSIHPVVLRRAFRSR